MTHSHGHSHYGHAHHGHAHSHLPVNGDNNGSTKRILYAFLLNLIFTIIEFIGGWLTNSTAILADAVHDLGDTLSIGMALVLSRISSKSADEKFTYGYSRFSLLGALINCAVLIGGSIFILTEAGPKLFAPEMPHAQGMLALSILGISVNGYAAYKLSAGKTLNEKVLNWHLIEDVLGWVAVFIVSVTLMFWDIPILDPLLSIFFTLFILLNVFKQLRATIKLFLQGTPDDVLKARITESLLAINSVEQLHQLHLWSLDGEQHVLTVHIQLSTAISAQVQKETKEAVAAALEQFKLSHTTIEFEQHMEACRDPHPH